MDMDDSQQNEFGRLLKAFHEAQERGDFKEAESIALSCLMFASEFAEKNPTESSRLIDEAGEHESAARWKEAESARLQVILLAKAEGNAAIISKAHNDLSSLYAILGNADGALLEAKAAVVAARKANMTFVLLFALRSVFRCHLTKGDILSAAAAAEEAVQITIVDKMDGLQRAQALLMRAQGLFERHQVSQAEEDLAVAWRILAPRAEAVFLAGYQVSLANWWEITARIKTHSKEYAGAAQAMSKAVDFRRTVSRLPQLGGPHVHYALAKILQQFSVALMAAGEVEASIKAFDESRMIQQIIGIAIPPSGTE